MHSLPIFVRLAGQPVILVGTGDAADAKRRLLERAGAEIVGEDGSATLAIVAVEDEAEATEAVARLKNRGILVNAVDRVALCDFTLPAIVDRDPVLIAIGSGGASAGLAKALRQRLEKLLPPSLGPLAEGLFAARPTLRAKFPDPTARRQAIDAALSEDGALDPFAGNGDVAAWLASDQGETPDRTETLVLTSTDPDELTLRAARLLSTAATVYHSANVPLAILNRARADATRVQGEPPENPGAGLTLIVTI
jgi:uroporphyrin-III C-methyltransferase / precorrin-2 dehydrogenase / sirohydrochlorin ferrochelatase